MKTEAAQTGQVMRHQHIHLLQSDGSVGHSGKNDVNQHELVIRSLQPREETLRSAASQTTCFIQAAE